jgi:hypothetical protein
MPRSAALAGLLVAAAAAAAPPALDPAAATPYAWRVVVRAKPHPLLPQGLRDQLARDLKAALGPAVGPLAAVEVIDLAATPPAQWDPLWKRFDEAGWPALDAPASRAISGVKTHFLTVEVKGGRYYLAARQLDGDTGLTSPLLRTETVDAADKLGRVAGRMVGRDFGPVATVESYDPGANEAVVRFRAGAVGLIDRVVEPGDVMAVASVREPPRPAPRYGLTPKPTGPEPPRPREGVYHPFTLLQVAEVIPGGSARCRVLTGLRVNPFLPNPAVVGVRGLKLAAVEGPVEVRVVHPKTGEPVPPGGLIRAWATDTDYGKGPDARDALDLQGGVFKSPRAMRRLAVVTVGTGQLYGRKSYPVPVVGGGPVPLPYEPNPAEAARAEFNQTCEDFLTRVTEVRLAQVALFDGLSALIKDGKYAEALDRANRGLKQSQDTDKALTAELARLRADPGKDGRADGVLARAEAALLGLKVGEPQLRGTIDDLTASIEKGKDPARFEKEFRSKDLIARAKQHLERGEGDDALAVYDQLVELLGTDAVKAERAKLKAEWTPKSDDQKAARAYLTGAWRNVATAGEFQAAVPKVRAAGEALAKADDRLGLRGLLASLEPAYGRIKEQGDRLTGDSPADRAALQTLQEVTKGLDEVGAAAREKIKALDAKAAKPPG